MGFLDDFSHFLSIAPRKKKQKPFTTVIVKVKMDCDGCVRTVRQAVSNIKGTQSVDVDKKNHRVTVTGYVTEKKVIKKVEKTGKRVEKWPYIENHLVAYPHVAGAYDRKAPPGFVKNVPQAHADPNDPSESLVVLFSDENAQGCAIM